MKENEAISRMRYRVDTATHNIGKGVDGKAYEDMEMAIKALEEIQQYRAIGTVEECREARERQRGKKPNITIGKTEEDKLACCPICEGNLDWTYNGFWRKGSPKYCSNCGQAISWEGEE